MPSIYNSFYVYYNCSFEETSSVSENKETILDCVNLLVLQGDGFCLDIKLNYSHVKLISENINKPKYYGFYITENIDLFFERIMEFTLDKKIRNFYNLFNKLNIAISFDDCQKLLNSFLAHESYLKEIMFNAYPSYDRFNERYIGLINILSSVKNETDFLVLR